MRGNVEERRAYGLGSELAGELFYMNNLSAHLFESTKNKQNWK